MKHPNSDSVCYFYFYENEVDAPLVQPTEETGLGRVIQNYVVVCDARTGEVSPATKIIYIGEIATRQTVAPTAIIPLSDVVFFEYKTGMVDEAKLDTQIRKLALTPEKEENVRTAYQRHVMERQAQIEVAAALSHTPT